MTRVATTSGTVGHFWKTVWLAVSLLIVVLLSLNYVFQPDLLAALTLIPPWFCFLMGLLSVLIMIRERNTFLFRGAFVLWLVFLVVFVQQSRSIWKVSDWPNSDWLSNCQDKTCLRVITLNCGDGGIQSLREVEQFQPDIIFLQESPKRDDVEKFARQIFGVQGVVVYGWNATVIARGELREQSVAEDGRYALAKLELESGELIRLISLRLSAPAFRIDFWSPGFWIEHRRVRELHRREIEKLVKELDLMKSDIPTVIGGDLNAPAYDAALWPLAEEYTDAFSNSGRGWGGSGTNEWPLFRVDQIWISDRQLSAGAIWSKKTTHSDHRMVVCDLQIIENHPR